MKMQKVSENFFKEHDFDFMNLRSQCHRRSTLKKNVFENEEFQEMDQWFVVEQQQLGLQIDVVVSFYFRPLDHANKSSSSTCPRTLHDWAFPEDPNLYIATHNCSVVELWLAVPATVLG
jgi:hypothetical protein